ncbi:DUF742 domain-containing protein [Streptomyces sp. TRM70308]|uniref:DUF742 domain-containing protein n=1 Tax=Streptomyces sp. TRM70308 TaxID=3131932 RepID=UPI003D0019D1
MDAPWRREPGQSLRPYLLTGGRTRPALVLDVADLLQARAGPAADAPGPEARQILQVCGHGPRSLAEVAASIRQPLHVTRVLTADLVAACWLTLLPTTTGAGPAPGPDADALQRVLHGLRNLA